MIKLIQEGTYKLIETRGQTKILTLNRGSIKVYAWVDVAEIGEILITSHKSHKIDHVLAIGKYRMYEVKDEPRLTDLIHLELLVGDGVWQGYLLTTGLPTDKKTRSRIIPTGELITKTMV